jgi:phosphatidate cytidylyltransferase
MAPRLSPGKTWEGLAGGVLFAVVGGFAAWSLRNGEWHWPSADAATYVAFYSVAVCLAGVLGDLVESLLKRDFGRKDSSDWMPGFGGVLDLIDSPLVAAPVAWIFWETVLVRLAA